MGDIGRPEPGGGEGGLVLCASLGHAPVAVLVPSIRSVFLPPDPFQPENLLLESETDDLHIKVADFGAACLITESDCLSHYCGTPSYTAPGAERFACPPFFPSLPSSLLLPFPPPFP